MTEVIGAVPENSKPTKVTPSNKNQLVDPEDSIATTKEEEWVTKKKIELTTTRQIETRVKRQVVLEDGKVVEDSGPMVTTNTTEDTEKQEHNQTERRTLGDDDEGENWVSVTNPSGKVKEVQEKTVRSREETEERVETENVQHLGDISDEGYMTAIKSGSDNFRQALEVSNKRDLVETTPKIIHQSLKTKKYIDTEDKTELSQVQPGGKIINEIRTTRLHEELGDCNVSDDGSDGSASLCETSKKEDSQKYRKTKEQDITEYLSNGQKIGEKLHYQAESSEGERRGDHFDIDELDDLSSRLKRIRIRSRNGNARLALESEPHPLDQKDVLSKKPSSFEREEETRKAETSKWLEYHFGSESTKSSKGSVEDLDDIVPSTQNSFINVTMKSQPLKSSSKGKYFDDDLLSDRNIKNFSPVSENYLSFSTEKQQNPGKNGYFQGISQWKNRKDEIHTSTLNRSLQSSPSYSSQQSQVVVRNHFNSTPKTEDRLSPVIETFGRFQPISPVKTESKIKQYEYRDFQNRSPASHYQYSDDASPDKTRPSPPARRKQKEIINGYGEREYEMKFRKDLQRTREPSFDRVPIKSETSAIRTPTPKEEEPTSFQLPSNKKLYQRTRFAADIPPPPQPRHAPAKQKNKISESFRKFVGKLRSSSTDRKNKKKGKNNGSRSPSPKENTYQNYNSLDNYGSLVDKGGEEFEEPTALTRGKYGNGHPRTSNEQERSVQRYYLGEDPFSSSLYGREKEYEQNTDGNGRRSDNDTEGDSDYKSRTLGRFSKSTSRLINPQIRRDVTYSYDRGGVQTLPRKFRDGKIKSKSVDMKIIEESPSELPNHWRQNKRILETKESLPHTSSLINVSFVNQPNNQNDTAKRTETILRGPAKPARTYRSNLLRSQSFNVGLQPGEKKYISSEPYKSNPHLHRLEESPPPLESPSIISNWNQSSKRVNEEKVKVSDPRDKRTLFMRGLYDRAPELFKTLHGDDPVEMETLKPNDVRREDRKYVNYSNSFRSTSTVNTNDSSSTLEPTPNSQYNRFGPSYPKSSFSPSYADSHHHRDESVTKTISRSESSGNDDYSETVRINSRSDDPLNPSETNTVKIFSKKKVPSKNGHTTETIESRETKTIMKSQGLRATGSKSNLNRAIYNSSPNGVVIQVRNSRI